MRVVRRVLREGEGEEGDGSVEVGVGEVVDKMGRGGRGVEGIFNPVSLNYMKDGVKGPKIIDETIISRLAMESSDTQVLHWGLSLEDDYLAAKMY